MDTTGHVKLQLGTSKLKDHADDMEVLRAELDGMEQGGEDADEAHMYALPYPFSNVFLHWPKHMLLILSRSEVSQTAVKWHLLSPWNDSGKVTVFACLRMQLSSALAVVFREQGIPLPAVEPLDVEVLPDDVLLPVGCVSAVVGPTIVVQVQASIVLLPALATV